MYFQVKKSHEFGKFPVGTTQVTYMATDHAGNSASCVINITVKGKRKQCKYIAFHNSHVTVNYLCNCDVDGANKIH